MFKLRPIFQVMALLAAALAQSTAYAAYSDKAFTLTNSGNGVLTVSGAVIADNLAEYSVTQNTCAAVAPGGTCSITVRFAPTGVDARPAGRLVLSSNGSNPTHSVSLSGTGAPNEIHHAIAASASDVNMASLFGNPVAPATYVLTLNAGVYVTATSTATNALTTGAFPSGSTVRIINNGYIIGKGGAAGAGSATYGGAGSPGGGAISLSQSAHIDNTVGYIYGGGGGGGGGGSASNGGKNYDCGAGSGGGGGGAGSGAGAAGGRPAMPLTSTGGTGTAGGLITGGAGGAGAGSPCGGMGGGAGGAGGGPGAAGATGGTGWGGRSNYTGGVGGAGGPAVRLNGNSVTWTNSDTTHVSGAVQ